MYWPTGSISWVISVPGHSNHFVTFYYFSNLELSMRSTSTCAFTSRWWSLVCTGEEQGCQPGQQVKIRVCIPKRWHSIPNYVWLRYSRFYLDLSICAQHHSVITELLSQLTLALSIELQFLLFTISHMCLLTGLSLLISALVYNAICLTCHCAWLQLYEYISYVHSFFRSWNSSISIATGYGLDSPGSIPHMARFVSSSQLPGQLWGPPWYWGWFLL